MKHFSHLNSAILIIKEYRGKEPFAVFLKAFFSKQKKFGSRDRRRIAHLCYAYFRLGGALPRLDIQDKIILALFLCSHQSDELLQELKPEWNDKVSISLEEKIALTNLSIKAPDIFPATEELSAGLPLEKFVFSHFIQPDLFLRLRPGKEELVQEKLRRAGVSFEALSNDCLALENASKLEDIVQLNKEAVVQDYSSQKVGEYMRLAIKNQQSATAKKTLKVWDCCAASGGKSIMLYDNFPLSDITVSDIRESILVNLKKRFNDAGIRNFKSVMADISIPNFKAPGSGFNLIIADVPCSGSGTWGRTPELLTYFTIDKIEYYAELQRKIISNIAGALKPGGSLLYITCSVYKKENEDAVDFAMAKLNLELIKMELLKGYDRKADTMFVALLQKPL